MLKAPNRADLLLASVPLVELDRDRLVIGACSGALVRYKQARLILTVAHSTGNRGNWAIVEGFDPTVGQTRSYQLGALTFLSEVRLGAESRKQIDVAFTLVSDDLRPTFQRIDVKTHQVEAEFERYELPTALDLEPEPGRLYGFAGLAEVDRAERALFGDVRTEDRLVFSGSDEDWYYFALGHPHPGDEFYRGCSGAPIIDEDCQLFALLAGRRDNSDDLRAVRLSRLQPALDAFLLDRERR